MDKAEAKTAALFLILSVAYFTQRKGDKQDAMAMEAERKKDAKAMEARMQEYFRLSTFLTIVVSLPLTRCQRGIRRQAFSSTLKSPTQRPPPLSYPRRPQPSLVAIFFS